MATRIRCVRCGRDGFVRLERIIKADTVAMQYYCGLCEHEWMVPNVHGSQAPPPREPRAKRR